MLVVFILTVVLLLTIPLVAVLLVNVIADDIERMKKEQDNNK